MRKIISTILATLTFMSGCASTSSSVRVESQREPFESGNYALNADEKIEAFVLSPGEDHNLIEGEFEKFNVSLVVTGLTDGASEWEVTTFFNGRTQGPFMLSTVNENGQFTITVNLSWDVAAHRKDQNVLVELTHVAHSKSGKTTWRSVVASISRDYVVYCNSKSFAIVRKIKIFLGGCYPRP